jgi:hypothetical protein
VRKIRVRYRPIGWALQIAGVLSIASGAYLTLYAYPAAASLHADSGSNTTLTGTAAVVTDPTTMERVTDVPITGHIQTTVVPNGRHTVVTQSQGMQREDGTPVYVGSHTWSMATRTAFGEMTLPGDPAGTSAPQGVTVAWPAGVTCTSYPVWIASAQNAVNARCSGTQDRDGLSTLRFTAQVSDRVVTDPIELAILPKHATLPQLITAAKGTPSLEATLQDAIKTGLIKDGIDLKYTYQANLTWYVDPVTGRVVDSQAHEMRTAWSVMAIGSQPIGIVLDTTLRPTAASVSAAVAAAQHEGSQLNLVGHDTSDLLVGLGYVFFLLALPVQFLSWRQRRQEKAMRQAEQDAVRAADILTQAAARGAGEASLVEH